MSQVSRFLRMPKTPQRRSAPRILLAALLLSMLMAGPVLPQGHAQAAAAGPTLTSVAPFPGKPGTVIVRGTGFAPYGRVYVALYDQRGLKLYETRWSIASGLTPYTSVQGLAFLPGGEVVEGFAHLCGAQAMVRAYDDHLGVWSNWLDIRPGC